jgi:hypothetical protein
VDDFTEGALNTEADASPADGMEMIDDTDAEQLATAEEDTEALNGEGGEEDQRGPIPYERFQKVNSQFQELNAWAPVLDQLRAQGFDSPQAVQAAIERQSQERETARLTASYQEQVNRGDLDPHIANLQLEAEIDRRAITRERQQLAGWMLEQDTQTALKQYPEADTDYIKAMAQATGKAPIEFAKASHESRMAYRDRIIAEYTTKKGDPKPAPEGKGGKPPSKPSGVPDVNDPGFDKWYEQELRKTLQTYR